VALPLFKPQLDPGPDFASLLATRGIQGISENAATMSPHGTTVLAIRYRDGVLMAGDRRATAGHAIEHRAMEKVFAADRYSAVAISGSAGMALEMVKLFQVQLEHYEKVEGVSISLEGKANQLSQMVRANMPLAMQSFVVLPLFCGYDLARNVGRIFDFDALGGRYEETDFACVGSGSIHAKATLKAGYRPALSETTAIDLVVASLYDAADEDTATGGPDPLRGIYPIVAAVDIDGYRTIEEPEVAARFETVIAQRQAQREFQS
jgi:proteasome beta subunit